MPTSICFFGFAHSMITIVTHVLCIMFSIVMWAFQNLSSYPLWVSSQRIRLWHQLTIINFSFNLIFTRNGRICSLTRFHMLKFCFDWTIFFRLQVFYFVFKVEILHMIWRSLKNLFFLWRSSGSSSRSSGRRRSCCCLLHRFTQFIQNLVNQSFLNDWLLLLLLILNNILLIHEVDNLICELAIILRKLVLLLEIIDYYLMLNLSERWALLHERCRWRSDWLLLLLLLSVERVLQLM